MTPRIHLHILASGSKGNAAVVEGPEGSVLVDCGLSRRELHRRANLVGCDLGRVCAVLVTHEHGDHTSGLSVICNHFDGPVYATAGTAAARAHLARLPLTTIAHDACLTLGGMRVQAFPLSHDVADPMCFRFEAVERGTVTDAVGWATDTGVLTPHALSALKGCRILGIEANHDPDMLANGPYPYYLKKRVGGSHGHLSNAQAAKALPKLVTKRTQTVVAMHISQKNNTPARVREALQDSLDERVKLVVASQDEPIVIW
jgi:phosphoribosyl 1,2-cyclic phosphodiesterase